MNDAIVAKTRLQLRIGSDFYQYNTLRILRSIVENEGFLKLYRGIAAPISVEPIKRATKFTANEQYAALFKYLSGREKLNLVLSIATGIFAGWTEAIVVVGSELVKIRMQAKENVLYSS